VASGGAATTDCGTVVGGISTTGGGTGTGSGGGNAGGGAVRFACNSSTASVSSSPVLRNCAISDPMYAILARKNGRSFPYPLKV